MEICLIVCLEQSVQNSIYYYYISLSLQAGFFSEGLENGDEAESNLPGSAQLLRDTIHLHHHQKPFFNGLCYSSAILMYHSVGAMACSKLMGINFSGACLIL